MNEKDSQIIKAAGEKARANRKKGFHCSESVFLAINDTFKITDPAMVKMVTGFHGGGGSHRKHSAVNLTQTLEGMAAGKPVVASNVGGVSEVLTDGVQGFVVDPRDFDSMMSAVRRLEQDRELRSTLGRNAARKAVQFDWGVVGIKFLELLGTW